MKRLCCTLIILSCLAEMALGFEFLGPSTPTQKWGQTSIGIDYSWSKLDIEAQEAPELGLGSFIVKDSKMNKTQAKMTVTPTDGFELFFRSGIGDIKGASGERSDEGLLLGGGLKVAIIRTKAWDLGIIAQTGWGKFNFDTETFVIDGIPVSAEEEVSFHEIQVAVGPVIRPIENITLYGGSFLHFITGSYEIEGTIGELDAEAEIDIEQEDVLGGYVGGLIELGQRTNIAVEYQITGSGNGVAASLQYKF